MNEKQEEYLIHMIALSLAKHYIFSRDKIDEIEYEIKIQFKELGDE